MSAHPSSNFLPFLAASKLVAHPALELIAAIEGDAFRSFLEDVREHGICEPIMLDSQNRIVDGRARRDAGVLLELDIPYVYIGDDVDVAPLVESKNVQRRHLTKIERAFIAAADLTREHEAAKERQGHDRGGESKTARQAAAEKRAVSAGYVAYADAVERCTDPVDRAELRARVLAGQMPLSFAARLAALGEKERKSLIEATADRNVRLTPPAIPKTIREINGIERFCLDPATTDTNPVGAREFYCLERGDDGLKRSWRIDKSGEAIRFVWVNPPYDDPASWVRRAIETVTADPEIAIWMLLQSRVVGTTAGREADHACTNVLHFDDRQKFVTKDLVEMPGSLNDGSLLYAFGAASCAGLREFGTLYTPDRGVAA
jgi:hypothetical protein